MYESVTGYFNTYYNAKKLFSDAVREINKTPSKDRDTNYFAPFSVSKTVQDKLDKVIEKCSKLIQLYPRSSWIEDAIIMIGQSYVYKGETESAIRKFDELIDNFQTSNLTLIARLWKAKALYISKKNDDALTIIDGLLPDAEKAKEDDILVEAYMLRGQIQLENEDLVRAEEAYKKAVRIPGNGELLAIAQYQLGLCQSRLDQYKEAAESFEKVEDYKPTITKKYQAKLNSGRMMSVSGQFEKALDILENLKREALKPDERGLVELEIANTYKRMKDTATAFTIYDRIDTIYKKTDASAKSYYERGLSYEYDHFDYKKALSFYDKAKSEFPQSEITPIAQKKAQYLTQYFKLRDNLIKYDSLLDVRTKIDSLGINADSVQTNKDSTITEGISKVLTDQALEDTSFQKVEMEIESDIESYEIVEDNLEPLPEENSLFEARTAHSPLITSLNTENVKSEGKKATQISEVGKSNILKLTSTDSLKGQKNIATADQLAKLSSDSLKKLIVQTKMEMGALFLLDMNLPDSALYIYQDLVENFPESKYTPRAYYSMAEIYNNRNDSVKADSIYKIILNKYDNTEYANQVKKSLGIEVQVEQVNPSDSLYYAGERLLLSGDELSSIKYFERVVFEYPGTLQAAKALYTLGWIQEVVFSNNDSAASIYKKLVQEYPTSIYANEVKPKLAIKDDPQSVDKYIKVTEIQAVAKTAPPKKEVGKSSDSEKNKQSQQQLQLNQFQDEEPEQIEEEPEEEEPEDTDDGGG